MSMFLAMLLAMVAGFVAGWAAHRSDSRAYIESRERYWADQLAAELRACKQELAHAEAARIPAAPAPAVIHVHVPALAQGWPQPPVINALPASWTLGKGDPVTTFSPQDGTSDEHSRSDDAQLIPFPSSRQLRHRNPLDQ